MRRAVGHSLGAVGDCMDGRGVDSGGCVGSNAGGWVSNVGGGR